jgi:hypothetical protein
MAAGMPSFRTAHTVLLTAALSLDCSCSKEGHDASDTGADVTPAVEDIEAIDYPRGPHLSDPEIDSVLFSASHILISHRGAVIGDATSTHGTYVVAAEPAARAREAALERARVLLRQLRADPTKFEAIARRESDDRVTAKLGGTLGAFYARFVPEPIVNALGYIEVGEISRVVETPQGFHLLRREAVAQDGPVALAQIVIKHSEAQGWRRNDRMTPTRTRMQARDLAQRVAREAQQRPSAWDALVLRYSDGDDALRGGFVGVRSRSDREHDFVLVELGSRLAPGGVSDVVETMMGFHVLRRLPPRQPEALAASVITVMHAQSQVGRYDPERRRSRAEAEQIARELTAELARHPERFDALKAASCEVFYCSEVATWYRGRMPAAIELALAQLPVAGISREPVDAPQGLLVLRREDTSRYRPAPLPAPRFDVPVRFGPAPVPEPPNAGQQGEPAARSTGR